MVPIGFYWNGEAIVVCTATTSPKVHTLEADPEVAYTVDVLGPPAKVLSVRGVTSTEIVPGIPAGIHQSLDKRHGWVTTGRLRSASPGCLPGDGPHHHHANLGQGLRLR